jgi:hypothetical protein
MRLTEDLSNEEVVSRSESGRGRALRTACEPRDADVLCYMDVDPSSDLRAMLPLLAPVVLGHSDVAIGRDLREARESRAVQSAG